AAAHGGALEDASRQARARLVIDVLEVNEEAVVARGDALAGRVPFAAIPTAVEAAEDERDREAGALPFVEAPGAGGRVEISGSAIRAAHVGDERRSGGVAGVAAG